MRFAALPAEERSTLTNAMDMLGQQSGPQVLAYLEQHFRAQDALAQSATMMDAPVTLEARDAAGVLARANENGATTFTNQHFEQAKALIDATINPHLGRKSPKEIRELVATLPISPELASLVEAHVDQKIESHENLLGKMFVPGDTLPAIATLESADVTDTRKQDIFSNLSKLSFAELERMKEAQYRTPMGPVPGVAQVSFSNATTSLGATEKLSLADELDFVREAGPGYTPGVRGNSGPVRGGGSAIG